MIIQELAEHKISAYVAPGIEMKPELPRLTDSEKYNVVEDIILEKYSTTKEEIYQQSRDMDFCYPRQLIMFFSKKYTTFSLAKIGQKTGGKNHATVLHASRKINDVYERYKQDREEIDRIDEDIKKHIKRKRYEKYIREMSLKLQKTEQYEYSGI